MRQLIRPPVWPAITALAILFVYSSIPSAQMAPVRLNHMIEQFIAGKVPLGTSAYHYSVESARMAAASDLDWVGLFVGHHGAGTAEQVRLYLLGLTNKARIAKQGNIQPNITPIIMTHNEPDELLKESLDVGVMGAIFMAVDTKEQTVNLVKHMRYRPRGDKGNEPVGVRFHGSGNDVWWWGVPSAEYEKRADLWPLNPQGELLAAMEIETAEGLKNIDAIASVPGVGAIFIGPGDLAHSMGVSGNDPKVEAGIQSILKVCLARNIPCGIGARKGVDLEPRTKQGFRYFDLHDGRFMSQ